MKMYHGISVKYLTDILKYGLKPRKKAKGNWVDFPSRTDMVYLTNAYAFYFAFQAMEDKDAAVVFEIDLDKVDQRKLYPDEDFIEQVTRRSRINKDVLDIKKNHKKIKHNLEEYGYLWMNSIEGLGNCCYKGIISPECISRYCVYDKSRSTLNMAFVDPSISLLNYRICGQKYRDMIKWMFGDIDELPQVTEDKAYYDGIEDGKFKEIIKRKIEVWTAESKNRNGVVVIDLKDKENEYK